MHRIMPFVRVAAVVGVCVWSGSAIRADVPPVASGTWVSGGDIAHIATGAAAAALPDGRIVITGGEVSDGQPTAAITIYDATTGSLTAAGAMQEARAGHAVAALKDGRVLIAGGITPSGMTFGVEIYDPASGVSQSSGEMLVVRRGHAAATLADGRVLIAGGYDGSAVLGIAEIFDPVVGATASVSGAMVSARVHFTATTLLDGRVMLAGGHNGLQDLSSIELYDPDSQAFSASAGMLGAPRRNHFAVLLPHNANVLISGGSEGGTAVATAELYTPWTDSAAATAAMPVARSSAIGAGLAPSAVAMVLGGGASTADYYAFATLVTDKDDYAPGETVTIAGRGWQPGETVTMTLEEVGALHEPRTLTAVANGAGEIVNTDFAPEEHHIGVRFYLTARGAASQARTTFSDSVTSVTITGPSAPQTFTALPALLTISFSYHTSTTGPTTGQAEILGTPLQAQKVLTPGVNRSDSLTVSIPAGTENGIYNVKVTVSNNTGQGANQKNDIKNGLVVINVPTDTTAPIVTPVVTGALGTNDWYTSDVNVSWTVVDSESALTSTSGCDSTAIVGDTAGTTLTCTATSAGGTASQSLTIKRDATPPTIALNAAGPQGAGGWYVGDVTVTTTGDDLVAQPVTCTADQVLSTDTAGQVVAGTCSNAAGLTASANLTVKLDKTGPTAVLVAEGAQGANGWYISAVTVTTIGEDLVAGPVVCTALQHQTSETTGQPFTGLCTNDAGLTTHAVALTVKVDMTPPTNVTLGVTAGTAGANGWYISDVTLVTSGEEPISTPITCTAPTTQSEETSSVEIQGTCTNAAGLTAAATPVTVKLDKTPPTAMSSVTNGTAGSNGWYITDVTVSVSGDDSISGPVTCTADQFQVAETTGTPFNGSCTNQAGLTTQAEGLNVKLDKSGPSDVVLTAAGTLGNNGWYVSNVTVSTTGNDAISGPVACSAPAQLDVDTVGTVFNGSCTNAAGLSTGAAPIAIKRDATAPTIVPAVTPNPIVLNGAGSVSAGAADALSGLASTSCGALATTSVGGKTMTCTATDNAGNTAEGSAIYTVIYGTGTCLGAPGHTILQPINADGTSVFKQKSTVPAKFRVCDANGVSIGTAGVVARFVLMTIINGTMNESVNEPVESTTPDPAFRWSATDQQWIFNINTKVLGAGKTYIFRITLDDESVIDFSYGLR